MKWFFLNEWWNPSSNRQAVDRINRIGQKKRNKCICIAFKRKTIDQKPRSNT